MRGLGSKSRGVSIGAARPHWLGSFCRAVSFVVLVTTFAAPRGEAQSGTPKPRAVAPQTTFEFGTVSQGSKVSHQFILKNEGNAPFSIQRVVPSCGCTASVVDVSTVPPGGEAKIRVDFDTTGFSGERTKSVRVLTSDSERPSIDLLMKGTILPDVVIEPAYVSLGDVFPGAVEGLSKQVTISVREGAAVTLGGVKAWSNAIRVTEVEQSSTKRVISVSLAPNAPQGEMRDRVVVTVLNGAGEERTLNIPVVASVKSELVVKPGVLSFGVIEGEKVLTRKATFSNFGSRPVTVREITSTDPALSAVATPIDGGKAFIIDVALDPKGVKSDFRGVLSIITDRQEVSPVALNVYGIVPPR